MEVTSKKLINGIKGKIEIPSDKSISHRAAIFSMLSGGVCKVSNYSLGADCHSTLGVIKSLGCEIEFKSKQELVINAKNAISKPMEKLNCGNSGTTMRLMSGILAGQNFNSTLIGDESLSKRPMKRIIEPLKLMGAEIEANDFKAPLNVKGRQLHGIEYHSTLASAQVKSAVLLAGLFAEGTTVYTEKAKSRNHTELMLEYLEADIEVEENSCKIIKSKLVPKDFKICGDISSAAFFLVAGAIIPNSDITIKNVGINPTRAGVIEVLQKMGADIEITNINDTQIEPVADIRIKYSELKSITIEGEIIPRLIDEIPIIALLATQAEGTTVIKDAADLKNKETDRIKAIGDELTKIGANIKQTDDGFIICGKTKLQGGVQLDSYHDHRIAMTLFVAGLISEKPVSIKDFEWVNISFPEFLELVNSLI